MIDPYAYLLDEHGQIRQEKVDDLLVEVISGKYIWAESSTPYSLYASRCPTNAEQDAARVIYVRMLKMAESRGCLSKKDLDNLALRNHLFQPGDRDEKRALLSMMQRQVKAKEITNSDEQRRTLSIEMEVSRKRLVDIERKEWDVLQHSAEAKAEQWRTNYFVFCCTSGGEFLDKPVWNSWDEFMGSSQWSLYHDAKLSFHRVSVGLPTRIIRALARTTEWRIRWKSSKESSAGVFDEAGSNWDRNKVNLIYWSDFYDSIYEHPECPDDETIQNDEWLQQWLNQQIANRRRQTTPGAVGGRRTPTYRGADGKSKPMTKIGQDQTIRVGTPYKIRTQNHGSR